MICAKKKWIFEFSIFSAEKMVFSHGVCWKCLKYTPKVYVNHIIDNFQWGQIQKLRFFKKKCKISKIDYFSGISNVINNNIFTGEIKPTKITLFKKSCKSLTTFQILSDLATDTVRDEQFCMILDGFLVKSWDLIWFFWFFAILKLL